MQTSMHTSSQAEQEAKRLGGHLTAISSIEENNFILNSFESNIKFENRAGFLARPNIFFSEESANKYRKVLNQFCESIK